jgi:folate-binding protein YgfZ
MPTAYLADRSFVRVAGEDAAPWLQNIVTCDVSGLEPGQGRFGALLTPQGKILFDFIVSLGRVDHDPEHAPAFYLETVRAAAPELARRLGFYRLRAKVAIEDLSTVGEHGKPVGVAVAWGEARAYQGDAVRIGDPRHADLGERMATYEEDAIAVATSDPIAYHSHRIGLGIPEAGKDFAYGEAFPHETLMDMLGGVDFRKGCYVGQEVVSRMQHRGTARSRIVPVRFEGEAPATGSEIRAGTRVIGTMGSSIEGQGLALIRLDRAEEALAAGAPLEAGAVALTLRRPDWWSAAWPSAGAGEAAASSGRGESI